MHFMEKYLKRNLDMVDEINSIESLLSEEYYDNSLFIMINIHFRDWIHRGTCISLEHFVTNSGIDKIIEKAENSTQVSLEEFIYYLEYVVNICSIDIGRYPNQFFTNIRNTIIQNVKKCVETINHEIKYLDEEDYYIIIEKDWKITEAAEIVGDDHKLGDLIYKYNHSSMKGDLYEKADKLCRLYKYFENISNKLKNNGYTSLVSDIGFIAQKLDVRHAPKGKEITLIKGLKQNEQEKYYDTLFNLILNAIILENCIVNGKDVDEIKDKLSKI